MREAMTAMWWIPEGTVPTVADAEDRIRHLRAHGPTPHAFTFRTPFPAPDGAVVRADDDWFCPAYRPGRTRASSASARRAALGCGERGAGT